MNDERKVTINVVVNDGQREWVESASGDSRRQALWLARDKYRGRARVEPEDSADR